MTISLNLKGVPVGTGDYNPVTGFEAAGTVTLRTLLPYRKNYQPAYPVTIPGWSTLFQGPSNPGLHYELLGFIGDLYNIKFREEITPETDVSTMITMNQVGLPADSSLVTVVTTAEGTMTLIANTN